MSREWIIRILALAAIAGLTIYIARNTYWDDTEVDLPLQGEAATDPYYALEHLLGSLGVGTKTVATLSAPTASEVMIAGNVRADFLKRRIESLEPWVEAGGRLVVGGWTVSVDTDLQKWSGIAPHREAPQPKSSKVKGKDNDEKDEDEEEDEEEQDAPRRPTAKILPQLGMECHGLAVTAHGVVQPEKLSLCTYPDKSAFTSKRPPEWSLSNDNGIQALRVAIGRGFLTVLPQYSVASNETLLKGDHAKIVVAAIGLTRGDHALLFRASGGEKLLPMLWRIAAPGMLLLAAAGVLLIVRQVPRFGTPLPVPQPLRRSLAEQIRAQAAFAWRTRRLAALRRAASRALDETAGRLLASYRTLNPRRRAEVLAAASGVDANQLSAAMTEDAAGGADVQRAAIALLQTTRRNLLLRSRHPRNPI